MCAQYTSDAIHKVAQIINVYNYISRRVLYVCRRTEGNATPPHIGSRRISTYHYIIDLPFDISHNDNTDYNIFSGFQATNPQAQNCSRFIVRYLYTIYNSTSAAHCAHLLNNNILILLS